MSSLMINPKLINDSSVVLYNNPLGTTVNFNINDDVKKYKKVKYTVVRSDSVDSGNVEITIDTNYSDGVIGYLSLINFGNTLITYGCRAIITGNNVNITNNVGRWVNQNFDTGAFIAIIKVEGYK